MPLYLQIATIGVGCTLLGAWLLGYRAGYRAARFDMGAPQNRAADTTMRPPHVGGRAKR